MNKVIRGDILTLDTRSMLPIASGTCDGGDCDRRAVTFAYCSTGYAEGRDGLKVGGRIVNGGRRRGSGAKSRVGPVSVRRLGRDG